MHDNDLADACGMLLKRMQVQSLFGGIACFAELAQDRSKPAQYTCVWTVQTLVHVLHISQPIEAIFSHD
jgi:hypothetical protein